MELHELQVGDFSPGLVGQPDPIARGWRGVGGVAIAASQAADRRLEDGDRLHPPAAAIADQEAPRQLLLQDQRHRAGGARRQQVLHFSAGGVAAGVDYPGAGVSRLSGNQQDSVLGVEVNAQLDQLADAPRTLLHKHRHRLGIAQPPSRRQGVGRVQRRTVTGINRGGDAALGVAAAGLLQGGLGQDRDLEAGLGSFDGREETGYPTAHDHQIKAVREGLDADRSWHYSVARVRRGAEQSGVDQPYSLDLGRDHDPRI